MMAEKEGVVDENSALLPGSAISMMATVGQVDANEQQQPDENEQDSNNRSGNIDAVTAAVPTGTGVSTGESAKSSNNAGNDVDEYAFDYDDDDESSDFKDESRRLPKHRFVTFARNFRRLEGMPAEVIQRALPEMYRDYLRCSDTRGFCSWSNQFCNGFTECFRNILPQGRREKCHLLQFDWVNETVAFRINPHINLHLHLDDMGVRLIHYMAVEDIKKFARMCWRCPRLKSILIRHDFKYDQNMSHFFLEAGASSAHSRLEQLTLVCCGCRMPTWIGSMITLVQSSTTLTTIELIMHNSSIFRGSCCPHHGTSKPPSCVDSNRIVLEGVLQCKSLQELILFPPVHGDDLAFMLMVEATLIWHRNMQGQGLFKLKYKGSHDHARLCPEIAFYLMRGALLGTVERLEISLVIVEGSTIAQLAAAAQELPLESKLALKHLQMMDIEFDLAINGTETSESMSHLIRNLPYLEYVAIDRRYLIPRSVRQASAPFVCFFMDSFEFPVECLDHFYECLPSSMICALHVKPYYYLKDKAGFNITKVLRRHQRSFQRLQELHIKENYANRISSVRSLMLDILKHNTTLLKCSCSPYDDEFHSLCRRNVCIRMLQSFKSESADYLVPAALAYLGRISRDFQSASSSTSSSVAVTTTAANVTASAVFTFLQKQQLETLAVTNIE